MRLRQEIKALRRSHKAQVSDRVMRPVHGQLVLPKELQKNFTVKIAGPMDKVYKELIQTAFRIGIRNHGNENHEHVDWDLKEADLANRASVITFFESPKKDFTMLFTGDAHDKHCAIRDTIAAWLPADKRPMWFFDVLKVPHHGSNVTADLEFYQTVKARVYLVCARQTDHGSPSYDTLKTIVSSIKYTGDNQNAPGPLHYLFFTNPDTLEPLNPGTEGEKKFSSNVTLLLTGDYRPNEARKPVPGRQEIYHYKCYRLKKAQGGQQLTAGRILLGKKNGELALDFKVAANDQDPDGEWVEITVADAEQKWWDVQHANESA
ncbi:hypothetical protein BDZ91DRAFT_525848 [Kalaharituber pfeilii]|nr:hypothetical protein BDZ91DRAFT_525848 [Kalaharituber pfeilii]